MVYAKNYEMAAATILDFCIVCILLRKFVLGDPIFRLCLKFSANACNHGRVMAKM